MAPRKKTDIIQLSKIRMREVLRAKLARDAERKDITLNAEIVDRLERSYDTDAQAQRESAIIDTLLSGNAASSELLRKIASELAKNPNWSSSEVGKETMIKSLIFIAFGREMSDRDGPLHEPWDVETSPRKQPAEGNE
jgi:hypothetical protein